MSLETEQLARRIHEIDERVASLRYDVDQKEIQKLTLERRAMDSLFVLLSREESLHTQLADNDILLADGTDSEFAAVIEDDQLRLKQELEAIHAQIEEERIPTDPDDDRISSLRYVEASVVTKRLFLLLICSHVLLFCWTAWPQDRGYL